MDIKLDINPATRAYLNALVNPFGATEPVQIPDRSIASTMCMRDHYQATTFTNNSTVACDGLLLWLWYGNSSCIGDYSADPAGIYGISVLPLSGGVPKLTAGGKYNNVFMDNYTTILGLSGSYSRDTALITGMRLVAGGLRVYSTTEVVTDSSAQRVIEFIGGRLSPAEIADMINDGTDVYSALRTSRASQVFTNQQGCTVRWNPLQSARMTEMYAPTELQNNTGKATIKWDQYHCPAIAINFKDTVASGGGEFPIVGHAIQWLECSLKHPTPLYSQPAPVDPGLDEIVQVLSACSDCFPQVAAGFSFKSFDSKLDQFLLDASKVVRDSTIFGGRRSAPNLAIKYGAKIAARQIRKQKKKRLKQRRKVKMVNLGGTRKLPTSTNDVPNIRKR